MHESFPSTPSRKAATKSVQQWNKYRKSRPDQFFPRIRDFSPTHFHHFLGRNPFGHSSTNLGSLYKGVVKDMFTNFKHLRKTRHTHHPVDDARGNAEALLQIKEKYGLNIGLD